MTERLEMLKRRLGQVGRVAVLAGGNSAERAISLKSGNAVHNALREFGVIAERVDPVDTSLDTLARFDRVFIALHGRGGEDGVIQGVLEHLGVPYTGSGVMASAVGMDKIRTKLLWRGAGLATPDFRMAGPQGEAVDEMPMPVIVKPSREGSSIGMQKVEEKGALREAIRDACAFDEDVLVERWVEGEEYTVAILNEEPLPAIRLETPNVFYDYEAKYESDSTRYLCPCGLEPQEENRMQALAMRAFRLLGCRGWGRVDLMRDQNGEFQLLEVNTIPGMTDHSLVPMAAAAREMGFAELVARILLGEEASNGAERQEG